MPKFYTSGVSPRHEQQQDKSNTAERLLLGKTIKHFRSRAGLTLEQLSLRVGISISQLSFYETGKREPKLTVLQNIAQALGIETTDLLSGAAPDKRSALEVEFTRLQSSDTYKQLNLPEFKSLKPLSDSALETIIGLGRELQRQNRAQAASTEGAKKTNTVIREWMRQQDYYLPDIEAIATDLMASVGHTTGALTHRTVAVLAEKLGFTLTFVTDMPSNTRSITDLETGRIYLPPASIPGGHGLRALALQAMAHQVLGHSRPWDYAEFLRQRLEINYFASACLMPEQRVAEFLQAAKQERNLAIEDLRDAFGVTHETAAHRFTNLATKHLDLRVHFYRTDQSGALVRGYANDGSEFPTDSAGNIEGQILCRQWPGRTAFNCTNRTSEFYQYTDTPKGTFWSAVQIGETESQGGFSITCGVNFRDAKWFRGRDTAVRETSNCPDPTCCKIPDAALSQRWEGKSWASAKMHQYILAPLPSGTYPGVDETEMYEFLSRHAAQ